MTSEIRLYEDFEFSHELSLSSSIVYQIDKNWLKIDYKIFEHLSRIWSKNLSFGTLITDRVKGIQRTIFPNYSFYFKCHFNKNHIYQNLINKIHNFTKLSLSNKYCLGIEHYNVKDYLVHILNYHGIIILD